VLQSGVADLRAIEKQLFYAGPTAQFAPRAPLPSSRKGLRPLFMPLQVLAASHRCPPSLIAA
jgi:hypothetical protein